MNAAGLLHDTRAQVSRKNFVPLSQRNLVTKFFPHPLPDSQWDFFFFNFALITTVCYVLEIMEMELTIAVCQFSPFFLPAKLLLAKCRNIRNAANLFPSQEEISQLSFILHSASLDTRKPHLV